MKSRARKLSWVVLAVFLLAFIGPGALPREASAGPEKSFLWKIRSGPVTLYLLGSIHCLKKEHYPLNPRIEEAFEEADTLIVEANINDRGRMDLESLAEQALYPGKDSLQAHVSRETYERVREKAANLGIPPEIMEKQRPWFLGLTILSMELLKMGFEPRYGVDSYFLAKANQKKVLELESFDYQLKLLSGFSDAEQEASLLSTLRDLRTTEQEFDRLVRLWKSGDTAGMEAVLMKRPKEDKRLEAAYEKLLYERNRTMASHVEFYLKTNGTYFVVVGAGHMIGEKGIVELLRKKGYRVEQF